MNTIALKAGQIWMDCDKRKPDRFVYINSIGDRKAQCINIETGKSSRVRKTAFKQAANGYILVYDPDIAARIQSKLQRTSVNASSTRLQAKLAPLFAPIRQASQRKHS